MQCFSGIYVKGQMVPCGQCMNCRINKGRKWTASILLEEMMTPQYSWFITLTYKEAPETDDGVLTLRKKKFQKWLYNTQQRVTGKFRYYYVGEYGENTLRPHYHMAIFPRKYSQVEKLTEEWKRGYTQTAPMSGPRAAYLAQYTTKKLTQSHDSRLSEGQEPEFRGSSRVPPLGAAWIPPLIHNYSRGAGAVLLAERGDIERNIRIGGKIYPLPPYILRRVRLGLGIPLLHSERLTHPGYYEWHQIQEAEWNPTKVEDLRKIYHAKKSIRRANRASI